MEAINKTTLKKRLKNYKKHPGSLIILIFVIVSAVITAGILLSIVAHILIKGIPNLRLDMSAWEYNTENLSMMPAIINTLTMTLLSLAIAVPIGVCSAIYLVEYSRRGNKLVKIVGTTTETLAGIPSIVYGLFGYLIFVVACGFNLSLLSGSLTLSIMILPTIMRTTEEALRAVPDSYREGSFGLGAGRLRTVFKIILPSAAPGILSGVILSIGRIVGETAALLYTSGSVSGVPDSLLGSGRTLSVHMYALLNEGMHIDEAYAVAVVLLVLVFIINAVTGLAAKKMSAKKG